LKIWPITNVANVTRSIDFGIKNSFDLPMLEDVSAMSDCGTPFVLALPDTVPIVQIFDQIAQKVD
jgi:hypothetical protein